MKNKKEKRMTPLRAIRAHCVIRCMSKQSKEVRLCVDEECPSYPYRMGSNPARKGVGPGRIIKKTSEEINNEATKDSGYTNDSKCGCTVSCNAEQANEDLQVDEE